MKLCLKTNLQFTKGHWYGLYGFKRDIENLTFDYDRGAKVTTKGRCIFVHFNKSSKSYLKKLTEYKYAPTLHLDLRPWDDGLGPFKAVGFNDKKNLSSFTNNFI